MKKMKKFLPVLLAVIVLAAVFAVPVLAQGDVPPAEPAENSILLILRSGIEMIVGLLVIAIGSERGTQLLKTFWNLIVEKAAPHLNLKDQRAFILAAAVAFFITYLFNVDLTQFLRLFDGFDPVLLKNINALLIFFVSTKFHDKLS